MSKAEKDIRQIALGAARSVMRKQSINPDTASFDDVLETLDELMQAEPNLIASIWYKSAKERQINLLRRDWNEWKAEKKRLGY